VWPIPKEISTGDSVLFIQEDVEVTYNGEPVCWNSPDFSCPDTLVDTKILNPQLAYEYDYEPASGPKCNEKDIVKGGISRAMKAVFQQNFIPWKLRPPHSDFEPDLKDDKKLVTSLTINQASEGDDTCYGPLAGEIDESYSFELTEDGAATIEAETSIGVLRGLETFSQLFYQHTSESCWYTEVAPVSIKDEPKFVHRGMLFDVARSWFEVEDILRTIDALSWNKMNVLHLHMTDTQSWPLEIPSIPELAQKGSYRKGLTYTPEDIARIQEHGSHRGVQVIVEVDMPTHVGRGVSDAFPDLVNAYAVQPYQWYCAQPPCGMFKLNNPDVHDFLEKLFDDLLPRLSPYTSYFHTGGDELNPNSTTLDEGVRSNDTDVVRPFLQQFTDVAHGLVKKAGLTPLVWEEMALEWELKLDKNVVIQTWLGLDGVKNLTSQGRKVIDSNSEAWVRRPLITPLPSFPRQASVHRSLPCTPTSVGGQYLLTRAKTVPSLR
ncbi:family 20 glycosylhydrolase, partial [Candidatus Bathyarchaeota archaeon]|nr:family 20 glycosylhydrolase [Candidatus Bathyarchaeota archaeon]